MTLLMQILALALAESPISQLVRSSVHKKFLMLPNLIVPAQNRKSVDVGLFMLPLRSVPQHIIFVGGYCQAEP
jgi:hypothetical protein